MLMLIKGFQEIAYFLFGLFIKKNTQVSTKENNFHGKLFEELSDNVKQAARRLSANAIQ